MESTQPNDWITLTEAGARWQVSRDYLLIRVHRKTLPARKSGQIWLVSTEAMEAAYGPEKKT